MNKIKHILFFGFITLFLISCVKQQHLPISFENIIEKTIPLNDEQLKGWHLKDIIGDTIPGISLERAERELLMGKTGVEVIVAVIDTQIDISHEDLRGSFWINKQEIPNNFLDDDSNGYIDDREGWNFIGNKKGDNIFYANQECVRIIQKFQDRFEGLSESNNINETSIDYKLYKKANDYYRAKYNEALSDQEYGNFLFEGYPKALEAVNKIFPKGGYSIKELDSLVEINRKDNFELAKKIYFIADCLKYNLTEKYILNYKNNADNYINYTYNINFFDRIKIDSFPDDISKINYGNNSISNKEGTFYHGTYVSGILSANSTNNIGLKGISKNIKIMPLSIAAKGNGEHDKDIALAIRYAVNNGAKIINMSFSKRFSLYKSWVYDAIKYAEEHDVLIVCASGNEGLNLTLENDIYPNDNDDNGVEVADNFIMVGSVSHRLDSTLISDFSNYGSVDVDLFAPGENIYTTSPNNKYDSSSGTSWSSAVTSGVAGLLRSYYPNLSAIQIKSLLLETGIEYDIIVKVPGEDSKKLKFGLLSKSGKVINVYNAILKAERL